MHDVAEILDLAQLRDAHGTGIADAADVIAREIDEHGVLRAFLRVRREICRERRVLRRVFAALARTGDRISEDLLARDFHEHLRRGADELDAAEIDVEHIRRRIDLAQAAVEMETWLRDFRAELTGGHDLEDIAREDVLLRLFDGGDEIRWRLAEFLEEVERRPALRFRRRVRGERR